jgi:nucleotide-binding universal stress UspA family protein
VPDAGDEGAQRRLLQALADGLTVPTTVEVHGSMGWSSDALVAAVTEEPGALVCMATEGRARTGSILGSVAEDVVRAAAGPALLVGPQCRRSPVGDGDGDTMVVAVDGSAAADQVVDLAASWATDFGLHPWIVTCVDPSHAGSGDGDDPTGEASGARHRAEELARRLGRPVDVEVLHGRHPADELVSFARSRDASVIVMGTHGATGIARLVVGSVCAATVHRAPCPVLVRRTLAAP